MSKRKTICDEQLADEIKKLLEQSDVDDTVITEVVAKINDGDKVVDADGEEVEEVDLDTDEDEVEDEEDDDVVEEEDEEIVADPDDEIEDDDDEIDFDEEDEIDDEEDDEEDDDEDVDEDLDGEEDELDEDTEEIEDGDEIDEEEEEELNDEVEDEGENAFAKLSDPVFADAFNRGYAFAIGLMKMGKLPEVSTDEAEKEEDLEPSAVTPEEEQEEAEKKVVAQDSIKAIKESLAKEIAQQFNAKLQAKDKVKSLVGEIRDVMAFDSANDIYKFALEQNGVNVRKYKPSGYEGMVDMMIEKRNNIDIPVVVKDSNPFDGCSDSLNQAIARLKKINSK